MQASAVMPQINGEQLISFQDLVRRVPVADNVIEYAVRLASRTRPKRLGSPDFISDYVNWGAGPRASQYLILGAKASALLRGRSTPLVEDVRRTAVSVLRHRIVLNFNADAEGVDVVDIIRRLMDEDDPTGRAN